MTISDEFDPPIGEPEAIEPNLRRILAPNPSPMTFRGTNTYLLGSRDIAVIDPGPNDPSHLEAILNALRPDQRISHILVTHAHLDHSPLAKSLSGQTGAPVLAYGGAGAGRSEVMQELAESGCVGGGEGVDVSFAPDVTLTDGETIQTDEWALTALWTPGHFGNHMSFATEDYVFTGDLVMGWASSLVSPPDGDLTDFMQSCRRLQNRFAKTFHPGHGAPITEPEARLDWLISHRLTREASILEYLSEHPATAEELTEKIYTDTPQSLMRAAERNVLAHLIDLVGRQMATHDRPLSATARFRIT